MTTLFSRITVFGALLSLVSPVPGAPAAPLPLRIRGTVFNPDGKPAAGATIAYFITDPLLGKPSVTRTVKSDGAGKFDLTFAHELKHGDTGLICADSPKGAAVVYANDENKIMLRPKTTFRVRFMDEHERPIAHAAFRPLFFQWRNKFERSDSNSYNIPWSKAISKRWDAETDGNGFAMLTGFPQGYTTRFEVDDSRFTQPSDKDITRFAVAAKTDDQIIHLRRGGVVKGVVYYGPSHTPAAGVSIRALGTGREDGGGEAQTDQHGRYAITRLAPGVYNLEANAGLAQRSSEWTAVAHAGVAVAGGAKVSGVNFTLIHGALIMGHVMDLAGRPLGYVNVCVRGPSHPSSSSGDQSALSAADGSYQLRVPAGSQSLSLFASEFLGSTSPQFVRIADGETKIVDWRVPPSKDLLTIHGTIAGLDGAPVAGAEVTLMGGQREPSSKTTDGAGAFTFESYLMEDGLLLAARLGDLGTSPVAAPMDGSPTTLRLAAGNLCAFHGQVGDEGGAPLAHVKVELIRKMKNSGEDAAATTTDGAGRYSFPSNFSGMEYFVRAETPRYGAKYSDPTMAGPGKTVDIPPLVLVKADSFAAGVVLNAHREPLAGAAVQDYEVPDVKTVTDKNGRFRLEGVPRGKTVVKVETWGDRDGMSQINSGRDDNEIVIQDHAPPIPLARQEPRDRKAP